MGYLITYCISACIMSLTAVAQFVIYTDEEWTWHKALNLTLLALSALTFIVSTMRYIYG